MLLRRVAGALVLSAPWACGLDLVGLGPIPDAAAPGAHALSEIDASFADATTGSFTAGPDPVDDASALAPAVDAARATADASDDSTSSTPAATDADTDAAMGPCPRLAACCPRLLIPEFVVACLVGAMQDAGAAACETGLASIADAGVSCP